MKEIIKLVTGFVFILIVLSVKSQVTVTYVGNMGVMISDGNQSILIDGIHDYYDDDYLFPTTEMVNGFIENDGSQFPKIVAVLSTHMHGDHFDGELIDGFLSSNNDAVFIGGSQACELLKSDKKLCLGGKTETQQTLPNLSVKLLSMDHVNPAQHSNVQNVGFLIEMGKRKILHVGDANWNDTLFESFRLPERGIDVAIIPIWMADTRQLKKFIGSSKIVVTHISPNEADTYRAKTKSPSMVYFTDQGQKESF